MGMRISDTEWIQLREVLYGLTLMTHESHGGHTYDLDECQLVWCIRGKAARALLDDSNTEDGIDLSKWEPQNEWGE